MSTTIQAGESRIEFSGNGRAAVSGPLTFESVPGLFETLERRAPGGDPVSRIDLAGVSAVDSAGLALLLEWQARSRAAGGQLAVHNAPENLLSLARLSEAVELLGLSGREPHGGAQA